MLIREICEKTGRSVWEWAEPLLPPANRLISFSRRVLEFKQTVLNTQELNSNWFFSDVGSYGRFSKDTIKKWFGLWTLDLDGFTRTLDVLLFS